MIAVRYKVDVDPGSVPSSVYLICAFDVAHEIVISVWLVRMPSPGVKIGASVTGNWKSPRATRLGSICNLYARAFRTVLA